MLQAAQYPSRRRRYTSEEKRILRVVKALIAEITVAVNVSGSHLA